jgi:hypothetical protein
MPALFRGFGQGSQRSDAHHIQSLEDPMKKVIALTAVLALAACGKKEQPAPAADSAAAPAAAPAPAPAADSAGMTDSMARDTTHKM